MKLILFTLFFFSLITQTASAQEVTHKDLIGIWDKVTSSEQKLTFQFMDSTKVKITTSKGEATVATYSLDTAGKRVKMSIETSSEGIGVTDDYYVRLLGGTTLRLEYANSYDPVVQTRPLRTYLLLRKRKAPKEKVI